MSIEKKGLLMTTIKILYVTRDNDNHNHVTKESQTFSNKEDFDNMNNVVLSMKHNTLDCVCITFCEYYLTIMIDSDIFPSFVKAVENFSGDIVSLSRSVSDCLRVTGYDWFMVYVAEHNELPIIEHIEVIETEENIDVQEHDYYNEWYFAVGKHFINTRDLDKISGAIGQPVQESIVEFLDCGLIGKAIVDKYGYNYNGKDRIFRYAK